MVEALYLQQFEPIDEEELLDDMRLAGMWQGADVTPDCVLAKMRLKQESKRYYRPKGRKNCKLLLYIEKAMENRICRFSIAFSYLKFFLFWY